MDVWMLIMENRSLLVGQAVSLQMKNDIANLMFSDPNLILREAWKILQKGSSGRGITLFEDRFLYLMNGIELRYEDWHDSHFREDYEIHHLVQSGLRKGMDIKQYPLYTSMVVNTRFIVRAISCVSQFWTDWEDSL